MNEELNLIADSARRIFADLCPPEVVDAAEQGTFPTSLWQALVDNGLTLAHLPEAAGGSNGGLPAALTVLAAAGRSCAPVPLAEHMIASWLQHRLGQPVTSTIKSFSLLEGDGDNAVPVVFASHVDEILVLRINDAGAVLRTAAIADCTLASGHNMAGEALDRVTLPDAAARHDVPADLAEEARLFAAATRVMLMSGALESMLELSVDYVQTRKQFGRPLAAFQAIQQQLAILAGEVAASLRAADSLRLSPALVAADVAIAKSRTGEACGISADIAHQVHGAIGYTLEHQLNHRTRRLWCWRDDYGNERTWQIRLGRLAAAGGADGVWPFITDLG